MSATNMNKYPSMASMASTTVALPPGYVPRSTPKKTKPFGPSFLYMMNRTYMGPAKRKIKYACVSLIIAMVWFGAGAIYLGLRNVSRLIVYNTEVLGPLCIAFGIIFVGIAAKFFNEARMESNEWRRNIRFKPSGLRSVVAVNKAFTPDEGDKQLQTGTFGERALKEVPKGGRARPPKSRSRRSSIGTLRSGRSLERGLDDSFDSQPPMTAGLPERLPRGPPPGLAPPQYDMPYPSGLGPGLPPPGVHGRFLHPGVHHGSSGLPPPGIHGMPPPGVHGMPPPRMQGRPGFLPPQPPMPAPGVRRYQSPMRDMQPMRDTQSHWGRQARVPLGDSQDGVSESEL